MIRKGRLEKKVKLCPSCKTRERAVTKTGRVMAYCRECGNAKQNAKNRRKRKEGIADGTIIVKRHSDGLCPTCRERPVRITDKGTKMGYCRECFNRYMRGSFGRLYSRCKTDAKERGKEFRISKKEYEIMAKSNCHYCGMSPQPNAAGVAVNGIDRLDNESGYLPLNTVPCCWDCNRSKGELTHEEFVAHCRRVANHSNFLPTPW